MGKRPLDGIKVVTLTTTLAGPAAAVILADWGADVIKIEPPRGDSFRYARQSQGVAKKESGLKMSPPFYGVNRGKKSVTLDLESSVHVRAAYTLISQADVFLSNVRQQQLQNYGMDTESLSKRFPRLVYCAVTGYGLVGPDKDSPGYDVGCFHARSGTSYSFIPNHPKYGAIPNARFRNDQMGKDNTSDSVISDFFKYPPIPPGGMGDITTGMAAAGGICAALVSRARTGKGQVVDTSLLHTGMWVNLWEVMNSLAFAPKKLLGARSRHGLPNPLINVYRASCGGLFWLLGFQSERHFPGLIKALGKEEWAEDPNYNTAIKRSKNTRQLTMDMDLVFTSQPMSYWKKRFKQFDVWWSPVNSIDEAIEDEQLKAIGTITEISLNAQDRSEGVKNIRVVRSPVNFSGAPSPVLGAVPSLGEHTEEVLLAAGLGKEVVQGIVDDLRDGTKSKL